MGEFSPGRADLARARSSGCTLEALEPRMLRAAQILETGEQVFTIGGREKAIFADADGSPVIVTLKGPGSGTITRPTAGNVDASKIVLDGTTGASTLAIKGNTAVADVTVNGSLKSFGSKQLSLAGPLSVSGSLPKIVLNDAGNAAISIGAGPALSMTLDLATNVSLTSASSIKSIKLNHWSSGDLVPDVITAPSVKSVIVKGDLAVSIIAESIGKIVASGSIIGAEIRSASSIGSITAHSITGSAVFAGVRSDLAGIPVADTDFVNPAASIGSLTLKSTDTSAFGNTGVAAPSLGKLVIGAVASFNGGLFEQGVAARLIGSITGSTNLLGTFQFNGFTAAGDHVREDDFVIRVF